MATNISMIRGDSYPFAVSYKLNGVATALVAGDTVYFTVKKNVEDTEKVLQKVITDFVDGKAIIEILPSDKAAFWAGNIPVNYIYDVQINFASGLVKTVIGPSTLTVYPGVTDE